MRASGARQILGKHARRCENTRAPARVTRIMRAPAPIPARISDQIFTCRRKVGSRQIWPFHPVVEWPPMVACFCHNGGLEPQSADGPDRQTVERRFSVLPINTESRVMVFVSANSLEKARGNFAPPIRVGGRITKAHGQRQKTHRLLNGGPASFVGTRIFFTPGRMRAV